jgi:flavin reductase (DIM6/NTAB) family NADH-FMN oxidoreductase RutF
MMDKIKIENNAFVYPMPMVLAGTLVGDRPNFMAVGWVSRVNNAPPLIAMALGRTHFTNEGIRTSKAFSVNVPGEDLMEKTDYCGLVTGKKEDKSSLFKLFRGDVTGVPMIEECPLCMECRLFQTVDLPTNELFIGEIVGVYTEERYLTDGKPDVKKINPFSLTMPDNNYWKVGDLAAKAWKVGRNLKK